MEVARKAVERRRIGGNEGGGGRWGGKERKRIGGEEDGGGGGREGRERTREGMSFDGEARWDRMGLSLR